MKWVLVFILVKADPGFYAEAAVADSFDTMTECFQMREALMIEVGGKEYFPPTMQAVCIRSE